MDVEKILGDLISVINGVQTSVDGLRRDQREDNKELRNTLSAHSEKNNEICNKMTQVIARQDMVENKVDDHIGDHKDNRKSIKEYITLPFITILGSSAFIALLSKWHIIVKLLSGGDK